MNFIKGMEFTSFSFSFIPTMNVLGMSFIDGIFDLEQNNDYLSEIGFEYESSLVNHIRIILIVSLIVLIHLLYLPLYLRLKDNKKWYGKV